MLCRFKCIPQGNRCLLDFRIFNALQGGAQSPLWIRPERNIEIPENEPFPDQFIQYVINFLFRCKLPGGQAKQLFGKLLRGITAVTGAEDGCLFRGNSDRAKHGMIKDGITQANKGRQNRRNPGLYVIFSRNGCAEGFHGPSFPVSFTRPYQRLMSPDLKMLHLGRITGPSYWPKKADSIVLDAIALPITSDQFLMLLLARGRRCTI